MNTPTPRTNRFYASFADGECIPNQDEWLALCESLETELTAACQEIDMLKSKYADHHAEAERLTSEINAVTKQRDKIDLMYHKIIKEVLECDPIPACKRKDDQLEPPWEVIARVREQRDRLAEALKNIASGIYAWHTCVDKLAPEALLLTTNEL